MKVEVEAEGAPELFTLSPQLAELLGVRHDSRPRILHALWQYIRTHKLQVRLLPGCDWVIIWNFQTSQFGFPSALHLVCRFGERCM